MTDRERFIACMLGEPVDRAPYWLFWGPWGTTHARWRREGMPEELADYRAMFGPDLTPAALPVNCGPCPQFDGKVIAEDERGFTFYDSWGIKRRALKASESMPEFLEFPVKNRWDWEKYKEERLNPDDPARLAGNWRESAAAWRKEERPIQLGYFPDVGVFGSVRWLLGDEGCLIAFCAEPDLVHDIMDHMTSIYLTVFAAVVKECRVDVIHIWEDMCSRHGPLIGPDLWREFMGPQYRRITAFATANDIPIVSVDTDGMPDLIIPPMMETGVNMLFPFEVAAGCDVNAMGAKYPTLGMMGGVDKRVLAENPAAIDRELERIRPAVERGLYIPELDHLVPDDVSWDNYRYYAEALGRLTGKV